MEPTPQSPDYLGVVVNKPWGYEYLMYQNDAVGVWYLHIEAGARTSLHCHPRKKTGLILLSGEATVSFLNDSVNLKALSKLMIRPGLFHSTSALSPEGIALLEIETPRVKENLVRLEDEYGREGKPYEGTEATVPLPEHCIRLKHPQKNKPFKYHINGCTFSMEKSDGIESLKHRPPEEVIIVLDGGLFSDTGEPILSVGDVVSPCTVDRLSQSFSAPYGISLLTIQKDV